MSWFENAACLGTDPDLFFPVSRAGRAAVHIEEAKRICRRCMVSRQCLRFALDTGQEYGVWGGLSEGERRALRRRGTETVREPQLAQADTTADVRAIASPGDGGQAAVSAESQPRPHEPGAMHIRLDLISWTGPVP